MVQIDTPRTDAGSLPSMSNGYGIDDISAENTFMSPVKRDKDLVSQLRNNRGVSLKTPRSRAPFGDRRNLPNAPAPGHGEFTPLLKSVTKKNMQRSGKHSGVAETPVFLKKGYKGASSPALPAATPGLYSENTGSSFGTIDEETPVPQVASSSTQATPLAVLPKRDADGVLANQGNGRTLREQENAIDNIEKENFGLKLKIHFLEESLRKSGPGLNQEAMKENTNLKVDKITMQKELARARKTLDKTEREVEDYRNQLQNAQDQMRRKHADKKMLEEMDSLKKDLATKDAQIRDLRDDLDHVADKDAEIERLKSDVDDLEFVVREKDRIRDDEEEELERTKDQAKQDSEKSAEAREKADERLRRIQELEEEQKVIADRSVQLDGVQEALADAQRQVQDLERRVERAETETRNANEEVDEARQEKEKAQEDLDELRDEMFNKSFNPKGHTQRLEEKAHRLQKELEELRNTESKSQHDAKRQQNTLRDENGDLRQRLEKTNQECQSLTRQLQEVTGNLERQSEQKDLLHSRHDALTAESQGLQDDLVRSQSRLKELEADLAAEKSHALENDRQLQEEVQEQVQRLSDEIDGLHRELEDKDSQQAAQQDHWQSQRRSLEAERDRATEESSRIQRSIDKLQEVEGSLSGKEEKLREALDSERERHQTQEANLNRDIADLDAEIKDNRKSLRDVRSELARSNEELRVSKRNEANLEEKVQALEDDLNVLQDGMDEEVAKAKDEVTSARQEGETLKRQLHTTKQELNRAEGALRDARAQIENQRGNLQDSEDQRTSRLHKVETELRQVKAERQSLQDKLATNNDEIHELRSLLEDTEAEREEVKSQLKQVESQADRTFTRDQEKSELKKNKVKLELEVSRLTEERDKLLEKNEAIENEIDEEIQKASAKEGRLNDEIAELRRKASVPTGSRERELSSARHRVQHLEKQVQELEERLSHNHDGGYADEELSILQQDLTTARKRETEFLERESSHREAIKDLKHKVTRLERQVHEAEMSRFAVDSPKSSVGGSSRKAEIGELRSQLSDAHHQLKDLRSKSRDAEKEFRRKLKEAEREAQSNMIASEQQQEQLEQEISLMRQEQDSEQSKLATAEKTITRLRSRIQNLEASLQRARSSTAGDQTIADERKDLHEMLKDAKVEAEDLQLQIATRESNLMTAATIEKDLRDHLQRVRDERSHQRQKSRALATELDHLQTRYEEAVENLAGQQKKWEVERKAMNSRVRFANTSISENDKDQVKELQMVVHQKEERHAGEINGCVHQIQWLRWKLEREEDFRNCLKFEKSYLTMQCRMYEAWYVFPFSPSALHIQTTHPVLSVKANSMGLSSTKLNLQMMKKTFGIDVAKTHPEPKRKRHVKTYAVMLIFMMRCKRYADEWKDQQTLKAKLNKALVKARRERLTERVQQAGWKGLPASEGGKKMVELSEREEIHWRIV
ncbi:MAG: hypothetical protein Q9174_002776 [Haloplaca sp. 1 TL-2023]